MDNIESASCSKKICRTNTEFHAPIWLSISSKTQAWGWRTRTGDVTWKVDGLGNHLSPQTLALSPLSICQWQPDFTTYWADGKPLHAKEGAQPNFASIKSCLGKYLALKTRWNKEFGHVWRHHPYLAKRVMLNAFKSRNPCLLLPWVYTCSPNSTMPSYSLHCFAPTKNFSPCLLAHHKSNMEF